MNENIEVTCVEVTENEPIQAVAADVDPASIPDGWHDGILTITIGKACQRGSEPTGGFGVASEQALRALREQFGDVI
jgi:hypothetical protein